MTKTFTDIEKEAALIAWYQHGDTPEACTPLGDLTEYPTREAAANAYGLPLDAVVLADSPESAAS